MVSRSLPLAVGLLIATAGCANQDQGPASAPASPPAASSTTASPSGTPLTSTPTSARAPSGPAPGGDEAGVDGGAAVSALCDGLVAVETGRVVNDQLAEASGLAASEQFDGVLWAHNDSGHEPAVFALGPDGADLGRVEVPMASWVDVEDVALAGDHLYLADIGDNNRERDEVAVYRFAEPDPAGPGIESVDEIRLRYPDGPHDAEALAVDPTTGALVVIDKDIQLSLGDSGLLAPAPARIYVATPPFSGGQVIDLELAGMIALDQLATRSVAPTPEGRLGRLGAAGVATGADIRRDGSAIALRTYATVWLFDRAPGQPIAEALAGEPCEAPTRPEAQGEAVAFLNGTTSDLVTVSEGTQPALNVARTD